MLDQAPGRDRRDLGRRRGEAVSDFAGVLRGRERPRAVSAARRELIRRAVLTLGLRSVDVSRYLSISKSSVSEHPQEPP